MSRAYKWLKKNMLSYTSGLKATYYSQAKENSISMAHLKLFRDYETVCIWHIYHVQDTYRLKNLRVHTSSCMDWSRVPIQWLNWFWLLRGAAPMETPCISIIDHPKNDVEIDHPKNRRGDVRHIHRRHSREEPKFSHNGFNPSGDSTKPFTFLLTNQVIHHVLLQPHCIVCTIFPKHLTWLGAKLHCILRKHVHRWYTEIAEDKIGGHLKCKISQSSNLVIWLYCFKFICC